MTELVMPRVAWSPAAPSSLGEDAVAFARRVGLRLDPEQEFLLAAPLGVQASGRWQSFEFGLNAPRQNGKGEVLMARELFGLYELGEMFIVHSAHEFKTSKRHFRRVEAAIRRCPELLARVKRSPGGRLIGFRYSHGEEAVEFDSGALIEFRTRTPSGMRGFDDVSLLVLDEAMILSEDAHGTMLPTVRASTAERGPQIWYAGSAPDQQVHDKAVVWARVRARGVAGGDPSLTYAEWSLDFDHPDEVPDDVVADPACWRAVNWAIERGRVLEEHMAREFRSLGRRQFLVELCGVGDWPDTEPAPGLFDMGRWSLLEAPVPEAVSVLAFDVSPLRTWGSIASSTREGKNLHVGIAEHREGTGWVVERLIELKEELRPGKIVCDERGPAASLVEELEKAGVTVETIGTTDYVRACGFFFDAYEQGTVCHDGSRPLAAAVRSAAQRPLGDSWAWSRKNSRGDISPLVAGTLALYEMARTRQRRAPVVAFA